MPARVVNRRHEPCDVYIGRPSLWGNPFKIGPDGTREEVINKYYGYILGSPALKARLADLKGKTLGCWCAPLPCHGDVLVTLVNKLEEIDHARERLVVSTAQRSLEIIEEFKQIRTPYADAAFDRIVMQDVDKTMHDLRFLIQEFTRLQHAE